MTIHLMFWCWAFVLTVALVACGVKGWLEIRRGAVQRHRRWMNAAVAVVVLFVASYVAKLLFMGREDLSAWGIRQFAVLRVHETFILAMLVGGVIARWAARRFDRRAENPGDAVRGVAESVHERHRRAGRIAVVAGILAVLTAWAVLMQLFLMR